MYALSSRQLGVVPVLATVALVKAAPDILNDIETLFTGSSYDATHQQILAWSQAILNDPTLSSPVTRDDWVRLRCWAGDQTVITPQNTAELFGSGSVAQGCGCEVRNGCRADAQNAVAVLKQNVPALTTGPLSSAPSQNAGSGQGGTIYTGLPGGIQVGIPVPTSTILNAQVFGVPVPVWLIGGALLAFAGGRRSR